MARRSGAGASASPRFQGELRVPATQAPLTALQTVHVHLGAADIIGRVALLDCAEVGAGADGAGGDPARARDPGRARRPLRPARRRRRSARVAGGRVLDIFPPTRHKRSPERLALLAAMRDDDPAHVLCAAGRNSPSAGVDLDRFAANWNLDDDAAAALWQARRPARDVARRSTASASPPTAGRRCADAPAGRPWPLSTSARPTWSASSASACAA